MLEAVFTANVDEIKVSGLTQWDRGQMLKITCPDLPAAFQVHFTNRARGKAIPVQAVGANNATTIAIPDEILCEPFEVLAHLYFTEGDAGMIGETVKTLRMPLTPRAQPEDYVIDLPQEQLSEAERVIQKMLGDTATEAATAAAQGALSSIQDALDNLPEGDTLIINDLTTGGASAALSAEMGKVLGRRPNPNLLHNWYFANCVNQRGQEVYEGAVRTVDRWKMNASAYQSVTVVPGEYINYKGGDSGNESATGFKRFQQKLEGAIEAGTTYTLSMLCDVKAVGGNAYLRVSDSTGGYVASKKFAKTGVQMIQVTFTKSDSYSNPVVEILGESAYTNCIDVNIFAVKLERGGVQTLAHWDGSKYVLNEIPNYGEELLKCQRYYQLFTSAAARPSDKRDFRPELRTNATSSNTGTIEIDGVTYYYANADL